MAWFRRRNEPSRTSGRRADSADLAHLAEFVRSRRGVEGFIEPRTTVTETTLLLVAHDGEWTRRLGYPQRMRDYNLRQKRRPPGGTAP